MSEANYFLIRQGQQYGPYTRDNLVHILSNEGTEAEDLVWTEGMGSWQPAVEVFSELSKSQLVNQEMTMDPVASTRRSMWIVILCAICLVAFATTGALFFKKEGSGTSPLVVEAEQQSSDLDQATAAPSPTPKPTGFAMKGFSLGMPIHDACETANNLLIEVKTLYTEKIKIAESIEDLEAMKGKVSMWAKTGVIDDTPPPPSTVVPISRFSIGNTTEAFASVASPQELVFPDGENTTKGGRRYKPLVIRADSSGKVNLIKFNKEFTTSVFSAQNLKPHEFAQEFFRGYEIPVQVVGTGGPWRYVSDDGYVVEVSEDFGIEVKPSAKASDRGFN